MGSLGGGFLVGFNNGIAMLHGDVMHVQDVESVDLSSEATSRPIQPIRIARKSNPLSALQLSPRRAAAGSEEPQPERDADDVSPPDTSRSSLRNILVKMRSGFTGAAAIPSAAQSKMATEKGEDARLPLTERKEAGIRALEALRESLTGVRGGKPIVARGFSMSRFPKRDSAVLGAHGAHGEASAAASASDGEPARAPSHPNFWANSRPSPSASSSHLLAHASWTDELEFVYDLLRSEELHRMLAVADASWESNEDIRSKLSSKEMRDYIRAIFSPEAMTEEHYTESQHVTEGQHADRLAHPSATRGDVHQRLRAPSRPSISTDRVSRRPSSSAARRLARRSLADDDTETVATLFSSLQLSSNAQVHKWRERILAGDEDLSIFELTTTVPDSLTFVAMIVFTRHKLNETFGIGFVRMASFCKALNAGYRDSNPFHNRLHAADVAYVMHLFVLHSGIVEQRSLEPFHVLAMIFGALVHDFRHPGVTSAFLSSTSDPLALTYNDRSILENFHAAEAFKLMQQAQYNIFRALDPKQARELRSLVVRMVLATDMADHFAQVTELVSTVPKAHPQSSASDAAPEPVANGTPSKGPHAHIERDRLLSILMHCADISHPFRDLSSHVDFSVRIRDEFFNQGDLERKRKMEVSPMFDRTLYEGEVKFAAQQLGFIQAIVQPLLEAVCGHFPALRERFVPRLERTISYWLQVQASAPEDKASS